ncbi:MAG: hydantoinase/oxoprolinase family protein, partial [Salinarimonas sp.]
YERVYGRLLPGGVTRVLNLRTAVIGKRPKFDLATLAPGPDADAEKARRGTRRVYAGGAWHEATIHDRLALPVDTVISGPAILEQADTTIFIEPSHHGRVDAFGNVVITRADAAHGDEQGA